MIKLTGERVIPELMKPTNGMLLEHIARYYFAIPYARGRVLDIACGVGYGSHMIAKSCKKDVNHVVGVDVDEDSIKYAERTYNHPRITYKTGDAVDPRLPQKLGLFDTIFSFETIEHLTDDLQFMDNNYNMLLPGGTLVLSTPFGQGRGKECQEPFHIHQYTKQEFEELFTAYKNVDIYYQRGVTFFESPRKGIKYPLGVAVCTK